jgi:hypothetical protein
VAVDRVGVSGGVGCLSVSSLIAQTVKIYSLSGQLVRNLEVSQGVTRVDGLQPGVYVVAGKKVLVR